MTDSNSQRISCIVRCWYLWEIEKSLHYRLDLVLAGLTVTRHRLLDLLRRVFRHLAPVLSAGQEHNPPRLAHRHSRAHVHVEEQGFHGDRLRRVPLKDALHLAVDLAQPYLRRLRAGSSNHSVSDLLQPVVLLKYQSISGQCCTWVKTKHQAASVMDGHELPPPFLRRSGTFQPDIDSMISSDTSKLASTSCTSSLSSRDSMRRKVFFASPSSSSTVVLGTMVRSADELWMSASWRPLRTAMNSSGRVRISYPPESVITSSAPASRAAKITWSSSYSSLSTRMTPFLSNNQATEPSVPSLPP